MEWILQFWDCMWCVHELNFFFENMTTFCFACLHDCKRMNGVFVFFSFIRHLIYGCVLIILIAQCIFIIKAQCKCVVCLWMWMWESLDLYNNWPTCVRHHILAMQIMTNFSGMSIDANWAQTNKKKYIWGENQIYRKEEGERQGEWKISSEKK